MKERKEVMGMMMIRDGKSKRKTGSGSDRKVVGARE